MAIGRGMAMKVPSEAPGVAFYWRRGWNVTDYVKVKELSRMSRENWCPGTK
jgi:hypothetical protein